MALESMPSDAGAHVGVAASPLVVRQTPPPAAPTQIRQPCPGSPQLGSIAMAVTRPESIVSRPVYVTRAGTRGVNGPASVHEATALRVLARRAAARVRARVTALRAAGPRRVSTWWRGWARLPPASMAGVWSGRRSDSKRVRWPDFNPSASRARSLLGSAL